MKKTLTSNKGITLIALVVTIIILIILAGVSINLVAGQDGIFQSSQKATEEYKKKAGQEEIELKVSEIDMDSIKTNKRKATLQEIADALCEDGSGDIVAVYLDSKKVVALEHITVTDSNSSIYVQLKSCPNCEFEINRDLKVTINDLGNTTPGGNTPEPEKTLKVGDVVSYNPSGTYNWDNTYASADQTGSTTLSSAEGQDFNISSWKVLSIENGQVQMVPTAQTSGTVRLQGAQGYNNAVKLLNDACSSLYSDSTKGITARSINMDDIEKIIINKDDGYDPTTYYNGFANYGSQIISACRNSYYPSIYAQENNSVINGSKKTSGLGQSEQTSLISRTASSATNGYLQESSIQPYQTYYYLSSTDFLNYLGTTYEDIILPRGINTTYWVASRCVYTYYNTCNFIVRYVDSGYLRDNYMFYSGNQTSYNSRALFPVVSLSSDLISGNEKDGFRVN